MARLIKIIRSKTFIIAAACLLLYTLAGFFLVPALVRHYVPAIAQDRLQKTATIGKVRCNPYLFTFEVNDLDLLEPDGASIAAFKRLFVDFELRSLFKRAWFFKTIALDVPSVNASIDREGRLNLAQLVPPRDAATAAPAETAAPPRLIVQQIQLNQAILTLRDQRQEPVASLALEPLDLAILNFTSLPGETGESDLTATLSDGATLQWQGTLGLNPLTVKGHLALTAIKAESLWAFGRNALSIEKPDGQIDLALDCVVDQADQALHVTLDNLSFALTDLALVLRGEKTPLLSLPAVQISGGRIDTAERQVQIGAMALKGGQAALTIEEDGRLNWQRIAAPARTGAPAADATSQAAAPSPAPWQINLNQFDLGDFAVAFRDTRRSPGIDVAIAGVTVALKSEARIGADLQAHVGALAVEVKGVKLKPLPGTEPLAQINTIRLAGGDFDLDAGRLAVEQINVEGGAIDLVRQADGSLNLVDLLVAPAQPPPTAPVAPAPAQPEEQGPPFEFLIKSFDLSGLQAAFTDATLGRNTPLIELDNLQLTLSDIDGRSPTPFTTGGSIRQGGKFALSGTLDPGGPSVTAQIELTALALPSFQPYLASVVAAELKSGTFSTAGKFQHGTQGAAAQTSYQGGFALDTLRIDSLDGKETFVGWKSLRAEQLALNLGPDKIEVGLVRLDEPTAKIVIEKDKRLNLANLIKTADATPSAPKQASVQSGPGFGYLVKRVQIGQGQVDFADLSLPLPFGTKVHKLKGNVVGLSSVKNTRAQIKLDGQVDNYGTARVTGELNTSDPTRFLDIGVGFKNVEMTNLTPYSGKFAGRRIDSGKLTVDLHYKIENRQLAGENNIVVDRLVLGEKIKSPDAINLPLDLALALLKDANGVIDLGLPVKGSLDSPEFSLGGIIGKAIVNLLTKIVTSPFRALAALIPGGNEETFKAIVFEPGSVQIPPPEQEKLANLAAALQKRPQLKLMVQGGYQTELDGQQLRRQAVRHKLAELKMQDKAQSPGETEAPLDFSGSQTTKTLEALFVQQFGTQALKAEKEALKTAAQKNSKEGGKAEDPGRLAKQLFSRLAEAEPLEEAALVELANRRATAIIDDLKTKLPAERLGTIPAKTAGKSGAPEAALNLEAIAAGKTN